MIIGKNQFAELSKSLVKAFIGKTINFLREYFPDWASGRDDAAMTDFIMRMIQLGEKFRIHKEINIQKLLHYKIEYGFDLQVHQQLEDCLTDHHADEDARIESFYLCLISKRYLLAGITLDSMLQKKTNFPDSSLLKSR